MAGSSASPADTATSSGRRVKHSRTGCVSCKERRLRCSEERPSCSRCLHDGGSCEYVLKLVWEDESSRRGVKHGRGKHAEISFVDPTPSRELIVKAKWNAPRSRRRHFLNTARADVDGTEGQSEAPFNEIDRKRSTLRMPYSPQILDLSIADGMLFQYYQHQVCQTLTLIDDNSNCYRQIVLPLSISHECVKSSILAVGALHLGLNQPASPIDYYSMALQQKQKTLHQLRHDLTRLNGSSNNHILVSMLMLCLFDITDNCQISWATHVSAAANLIAMKKTELPEPSLVSFVSKFFATRDVMGRSACGKRAKFREIAWERPQEVDKTTGCSSELLAIIASITDISRQMAGIENSDSPDLMNRIIKLETQLDDLFQVLPEDDVTTSPKAIVLARTSSLIHNAAKIYFYTSLHSALPSTHIIRDLVAGQIFLLQSMTALQSAHLWSIFVTALYVCKDDERIFFLDQFDRLENLSATRSSTQSARTIVQTVWKKRDLDADSEQVEPDISDWVRYVQPMSEGLSLA